MTRGPQPEAMGTILFVDDEAMLRELAKDALEAFGYQVLLAENGQQAVDRYREHHGDLTLVLMDMTMPLMDGLAALREMRAVDPGVPVILCTGYSEHDLSPLEDGLRPEGFLLKPFRIREMGEAIQKVLAARPGA